MIKECQERAIFQVPFTRPLHKRRRLSISRAPRVLVYCHRKADRQSESLADNEWHCSWPIPNIKHATMRKGHPKGWDSKDPPTGKWHAHAVFPLMQVLFSGQTTEEGEKSSASLTVLVPAPCLSIDGSTLACSSQLEKWTTVKHTPHGFRSQETRSLLPAYLQREKLCSVIAHTMALCISVQEKAVCRSKSAMVCISLPLNTSQDRSKHFESQFYYGRGLPRPLVFIVKINLCYWEIYI